MQPRTWLDVAVLVKTKNTKGRFAARAVAGLPFLLEEGDEVCLVPPQIDVPRQVSVAEVRDTGEDAAEITFAGIDSIDIAQQMVGMHCLIRRDLVDEAVFHDSPGTWEGWEVVDDGLGLVGQVVDVIQNPSQSLLEVSRPEGKTALVPVVDEIIHEVDVENRTVHVSLPKGLLDL